MKRNYTTAVSAPVDMNTLRRDLLKLAGREYKIGKHVSVKLPLDMEGFFPLTRLYDWRGNLIGIHDIAVRSTPKADSWRNKSSKHRIFAVINLRHIPVGRLNQAKL
jgi:hypothetical protein